jgi:hypothetical protein
MNLKTKMLEISLVLTLAAHKCGPLADTFTVGTSGCSTVEFGGFTFIKKRAKI